MKGHMSGKKVKEEWWFAAVQSNGDIRVHLFNTAIWRRDQLCEEVLAPGYPDEGPRKSMGA